MSEERWVQKQIRLEGRSRGFHLVTEELLAGIPELSDFQVGLAHFFIQHSSASLTVNENADPDVRHDMEVQVNEMVPEGKRHFRHTTEGPDDMPAHVKASLFGAGVTVPVRKGRLFLGTWQGIYLCEHRNHGGSRSVVVTVFGK